MLCFAVRRRVLADAVSVWTWHATHPVSDGHRSSDGLAGAFPSEDPLQPQQLQQQQQLGNSSVPLGQQQAGQRGHDSMSWEGLDEWGVDVMAQVRLTCFGCQ